MSLNHHLLAKITTDSILGNFKSGIWHCCEDVGPNFYRVGCENTFPSPDAAFYDDERKLLATFEFKPPTENKRGILTGLGQSIAYLKNSNISFLIVPSKLEDFNIGDYLGDLYRSKIRNNLPVGLIVYDSNSPSNVELVHNVNSLSEKEEFTAIANTRFWAKHLDLPVPLFHLILHCYYLKKTGQIIDDAFAYCWNNFLVPRKVIARLQPIPIKDINGDLIKTLSGRKNIIFFEKKITSVRGLRGKNKYNAIKKLLFDSDTSVTGDSYYNSIKKNFITFIKHIGAIDSTGNLTDEGFKLYHLGLANGPNSLIFQNYFLQKVLIVGNHLDLIFDLDNLCTKYRGEKNITQIKDIMMNEYEAKGMIKKNPNRIVGEASSVGFLKYEFILWNSFDLIIKSKGIPEISFNWKKITEICSLPGL